MSLPVAFGLIRKPYLYCDVSIRQAKRKSEETKNEMLRRILKTSRQNQLKYRYVLADSSFSAQENLAFVRQELDKHFAVALKSNRTVALDLEDKQQGRCTLIGQLPWLGQVPVKAWPQRAGFSRVAEPASLYGKRQHRVPCTWPVAASTVAKRRLKRPTKNGGKSKSCAYALVS
jgi:SRSO17 transposase